MTRPVRLDCMDSLHLLGLQTIRLPIAVYDCTVYVEYARTPHTAAL